MLRTAGVVNCYAVRGVQKRPAADHDFATARRMYLVLRTARGLRPESESHEATEKAPLQRARVALGVYAGCDERPLG